MKTTMISIFIGLFVFLGCSVGNDILKYQTQIKELGAKLERVNLIVEQKEAALNNKINTLTKDIKNLADELDKIKKKVKVLTSNPTQLPYLGITIDEDGEILTEGCEKK